MLLSLVETYTRFLNFQVPEPMYWAGPLLAIPMLICASFQSTGHWSKSGYLGEYITLILYHTMITVLVSACGLHSFILSRRASSPQTRQALRNVFLKLIPCNIIAIVVFVLQLQAIQTTLKIDSMDHRHYASNDPTFVDRRGCSISRTMNAISFDLAKVAITLAAVLFYRVDTRILPWRRHDLSQTAQNSPSAAGSGGGAAGAASPISIRVKAQSSEFASIRGSKPANDISVEPMSPSVRESEV